MVAQHIRESYGLMTLVTTVLVKKVSEKEKRKVRAQIVAISACGIYLVRLRFSFTEKSWHHDSQFSNGGTNGSTQK